MKHSIRGVFLIILTGLLWLPGRSAATEPLPTSAGPLFCGAPEYFFGWVDNRSSVYHVFVLENRTNQPLAVRLVEPSSGESGEAVVQNLVLPPGAKHPASLAFSPRAQKGEVTRDFLVELPDYPGQTLTLRFRGEARQAIQLDPELVAFGTIPVDAAVTQHVVLTFHTSWPLQVDRATSLSPHFRAEVKRNEAGPGYRINVSTAPPLPAGELSGTVQVLTDDPVQPILNLSVTADAQLPLRVEPAELVFPADGVSAEPLQVTIISEGRPFLIKEVVAPPPWEAKWTQPGASAGVITLTLPPDSPPPEPAVLRIRTDVAVQPEILVLLRRSGE